ncbi:MULTISPECIES: hypothetical protein [unclassified Luteimonas]
MYRTDSNALVAPAASTATSRNAALPSRYPSRDFGTGYGRSSGYAAAHRYAPASQPIARFRLV